MKQADWASLQAVLQVCRTRVIQFYNNISKKSSCIVYFSSMQYICSHSHVLTSAAGAAGGLPLDSR
jgi:hypothetical protein